MDTNEALIPTRIIDAIAELNDKIATQSAIIALLIATITDLRKTPTVSA